MYKDQWVSGLIGEQINRLSIILIFLISLFVFIPLTSMAQDDPIGDLILKHSKQLTIVIDPGHGGKDTGAIGHRRIREKDIVLQIAQRLKSELKKQIGADIILTRGGDRFITLDERDQIAVRKKADIFLSIHANAARRKEANGIEIYYLNNATDEAAQKLAARENRGSGRTLSDLKSILSNLIQTESTLMSEMLAQEVYRNLKKDIASRYALERLHVKTALFYVLVGAQAPSLLIEIGYITNPREARRLTQKLYQEQLTRALARGVVAYVEMLESREVNL